MSFEHSADLTVVVLTLDEEQNLGYCLESVRGLAREIIVVDSGSTDGTRAIALRHGARFHVHPFTDQASQLNWAIENLPITTEWILRLDADESPTPELSAEILKALSASDPDVNGFYIKYRMMFLGRWIRHGGYYPVWLLRLFRRGKARYEQVRMDEHLMLQEGSAVRLTNDFVHEDRKGLSAWLQKHEGYATRQANLLLSMARHVPPGSLTPRLLGEQPHRKRWLKANLYAGLPLFVRAGLYFLYAYVFRLGFLDGTQGLIFHFLHAGWYMFYVDAKIYEQRKLKG